MSTPLKDALNRIGKEDGFSIGGDLKKKQVEAEATITPGNWTLSAAWQYAKDTGHALLGKITWRPK